MPVNAPGEYYAAEAKFKNAKAKEDKIAALEEMISLLPRHHGSENAHAQLKSRLSKLKKEGGKKGARQSGIHKEGDAQVCLIGYTNSGKSQLLAALTDVKPKIDNYEYTTTKPEVGMMDYKGIKIQMIEIPSTFGPAYFSIARTAELVVLVIKNEKEEKMLKDLIKDKYVKTKSIVVNPWKTDAKKIKENIWDVLGRIVVYTKKTKTPMSLPKGSTVKKATEKIHKDFLTNFRFARVLRKGRIMQVGLDYILKDDDIIEIYA
jgi:uncharacterized protein